MDGRMRWARFGGDGSANVSANFSANVSADVTADVSAADQVLWVGCGGSGAVDRMRWVGWSDGRMRRYGERCSSSRTIGCGGGCGGGCIFWGGCGGVGGKCGDGRCGESSGGSTIGCSGGSEGGCNGGGRAQVTERCQLGLVRACSCAVGIWLIGRGGEGGAVTAWVRGCWRGVSGWCTIGCGGESGGSDGVGEASDTVARILRSGGSCAVDRMRWVGWSDGRMWWVGCGGSGAVDRIWWVG